MPQRHSAAHTTPIKRWAPLLAGIDASLPTPRVKVLRLSLDPDGLAPRIVNLHEWRAHLLERLRHQIYLTADAVLVALLGELRGFRRRKVAPA